MSSILGWSISTRYGDHCMLKGLGSAGEQALVNAVRVHGCTLVGVCAGALSPPLWGQITWYPQGLNYLDNYLDKIGTPPQNHFI